MEWFYCSLLAAAGLAVLGTGFYLLWRQLILTTRGIKTQGKVIGLSKDYAANGTAYYPVVEFTDESGRAVMVKEKVGSGYPPKKGSLMEVRYDPEKPKDAILGNSLTNWIVRFIVGGVGAGMLAFAWIWFRVLQSH